MKLKKKFEEKFPEKIKEKDKNIIKKMSIIPRYLSELYNLSCPKILDNTKLYIIFKNKNNLKKESDYIYKKISKQEPEKYLNNDYLDYVKIINDFQDNLDNYNYNCIDNINLREFIIGITERTKSFLFPIKKDLKENYIASFKQCWINKWINLFVEKTNDILYKKRGEQEEIKEIGLFNYYYYKREYKNRIKNIFKNLDENKKEVKIIDNFEIENKGILEYIHEYSTINLNDGAKGKWEVTNFNDKKDILKKLNCIISHDECFCGKKFNELIQNFKDSYDKILNNNGKDLTGDLFLKTKTSFRLNNGEYYPSSGEQALALLSSCLEKENVDYFFLDEPDVNISQQNIAKIIIPKIEKLERDKKSIFIVTHNPALGINLKPLNIIYRELDMNKGDKIKCKTYINQYAVEDLVNIDDPNDVKKISNILLINYEGDEENYEFRNKEYSIRDK